ncbi:hypothetical protein EYF80_032390 [Liparis tanakae]|uniref:Uncharacterized protein n=1 Tax=Liparis tanakae TaxID=230148 RepID=A0A4Z2GVP0_9TELE|nr:hypothetical protein EYF80_032390 [Liparis tanakae]
MLNRWPYYRSLADWRRRNKPKTLAELTPFPSDLLRLTGDHCRRPDRESGFCALSMPNLSGSTCLATHIKQMKTFSFAEAVLSAVVLTLPPCSSTTTTASLGCGRLISLPTTNTLILSKH